MALVHKTLRATAEKVVRAIQIIAIRHQRCLIHPRLKEKAPLTGAFLGGRGWHSCNSEEPTLASRLKRQHRTVVRTVYNTVLCAEHTKIHPDQKEKAPLTGAFLGGRGWIRTTEVTDNRFTVCSLWPLGNPPRWS